jgi:hypothetical protein
MPEIRNPKHEIRNKSEAPNHKFKEKAFIPLMFEISDFELRIFGQRP